MDRRRQAFFLLTGLIVTFVRNNIQYSRYSFASVWEFLGLWFVHYLAVLLVGVFFYVVLEPTRTFLLPQRSKISSEEALVNFGLAVLLCSIVIFVLAHMPAGD